MSGQDFWTYVLGYAWMAAFTFGVVLESCKDPIGDALLCILGAIVWPFTLAFLFGAAFCRWVLR